MFNCDIYSYYWKVTKNWSYTVYTYKRKILITTEIYINSTLVEFADDLTLNLKVKDLKVSACWSDLKTVREVRVSEK